MRLLTSALLTLSALLLIPSTALGRDKDPQLDRMLTRAQELMMVLHDVRHNQLPLRKAQREAFDKELRSWAKELQRNPISGKVSHDIKWLSNAVSKAAAELDRQGKTSWKGTIRAARKISQALSDVKHSVPGETAYANEEKDAWMKGSGNHTWWSHAEHGRYLASSAANKEAPRLLKSRLLGGGTIARGTVRVEKPVFEHRGSGLRSHISTGSSLQIRWEGGTPVPVLRQTDLYGDLGNLYTPKYINMEAKRRKPVTVPLDRRGDAMLRKAGIRMSVAEVAAAVQKEQQVQTGARRILERHRPDALAMPNRPPKKPGQRTGWLGRARARVQGFFSGRRNR